MLKEVHMLEDSLVFQDSVHFSSAVKLCVCGAGGIKSIFSGVSRSPLILLVMLTNAY